jgi:hypothetical protein
LNTSKPTAFLEHQQASSIYLRAQSFRHSHVAVLAYEKWITSGWKYRWHDRE